MLRVSPSLLNRVGIRIPIQKTRNFTTFCSSSSHCHSTRYVSAENAVCKYTDSFYNSRLNINDLNWSIFFVSLFILSYVVPLPLLAFVMTVFGHWLLSWARK
jgi:hypothetical protein